MSPGLVRDDTRGSRASLGQAKKKCDAAKGNIKTAELPSMTPAGQMLAIRAAYDDLEEAQRQLLVVAEFICRTHGVPAPEGFGLATGEPQLLTEPEEPETIEREFRAKFTTQCPECDLPIRVGQRGCKTSKGRSIHRDCFKS